MRGVVVTCGVAGGVAGCVTGGVVTAMKVAMAEMSEDIVMVIGLDEPEMPPDHLEKTYPVLGIAVKVTEVPEL